ncbi:MAG: dihydroorotate dehydrogenase electron transfer subunit [Candidatus Dormiibacterota bacterium]
MTQLLSTSAKHLTGESQLSRAVDEQAECTSVLPLEGNLFQISFFAPEIARQAQPGEFAQLRVEEGDVPLLRRPFSFSRADPETGEIAFYVGVVGEGSRRLRGFAPGQRARILGPLGQGFTLPDRPGRSAVISGGLGAAPFPLLTEVLLRRGEEVVWINGARTAAELYPEDLVPAGVGQLIRLTEDGSSGRSGRVTEGLESHLRRAQRAYACGPNQMLAAVFRSLGEAAGQLAAVPELEVSIEAPMGCGFGTCLGCAIPMGTTRGDERVLGLCCRQGPVFPASTLDWERLLTQPAHLE